MTPEGRVKAKIKAYLKTLPNCWFFMPVSNGMGSMGIPDIIICYRGQFVAIEVKAPGKTANTTPLQRHTLAQIEGAGGWTFVADTLEGVTTWLSPAVAYPPSSIAGPLTASL